MSNGECRRDGRDCQHWRNVKSHLAAQKRRPRIQRGFVIPPEGLMCASAHVAAAPAALDLFIAAGILREHDAVPSHLRLFASQSDRVLSQVHDLVEHGEMSSAAAADFAQLLADACARVMCHPIVASNRYLERFSQGVTFAQAGHEVQQFSVFAAQFDVAQAKLVANAPTVEAYTERLNVLLNEKGIPYE